LRSDRALPSRPVISLPKKDQSPLFVEAAVKNIQFSMQNA
jgi:hypothetical protein